MKYVETTGIDYMSLDAPLAKGNQSSIEQLEGTTHINHIPEMKNAAKAAMTGFTQIMREVQKNAQATRLLIDKVLQLINKISRLFGREFFTTRSRSKSGYH